MRAFVGGGGVAGDPSATQNGKISVHVTRKLLATSLMALRKQQL